MRTETSVRTMRRDGQVWVHAGDLATFMTTQRRTAFEMLDDRGHQIFAWLSSIFEKIATDSGEVLLCPLNRPPTPEELQRDLIVLRSELQEDHG